MMAARSLARLINILRNTAYPLRVSPGFAFLLSPDQRVVQRVPRNPLAERKASISRVAEVPTELDA
jgi:hypothetical protein